MGIKKILSIILIISLITNLVLFAARKIQTIWFWAIIATAAILAFWILPKIKN